MERAAGTSPAFHGRGALVTGGASGIGLATARRLTAEGGRGGGSIVATASLAGLVAYATDPLYALTKHAVVGLVRGLAPLLAEHGVKINCVCPGITDTPMIGAARDALVETGFPLITPEEIA